MISRRQLIIGSAAVALTFATRRIFAREDVIPLWPDDPPGGGGPGGTLRISPDGAWSNIVSPAIQRFQPEEPNGKAVLIAAGGGYRWIGMKGEAWPVASWLTAQGYTVYVLSYRLPGEKWHSGSYAPLQDAQRAMRLIRAMENNVHLLGFSAGGHLLGLAAGRTDFISYPTQDEIDNQPAKADSVALIYPIITLTPPYTRTHTHQQLVGEKATADDERRWSVESYVTRQYPPTFLAQAEDDPIANPHNTVIMHNTCRRMGVPVEQINISRGGHGFGLGQAGSPAAIWDAAYAAWLRSQKS